MAPRRKTKKKRRRVAARVQVPRVCAPALARLLSGGHRSELRLTLGEAVKGLWAHARAHGLQDGREIRCDDYMRRLFDCDRLGMFDIAGALSKHMTGAAAAAGSAAGTARSGSAASHTLVTLSPALTSLLCGSANGGGGGPRELTVSHGEALRLLGKYITRRGLRDATDRRKIHCDAALAELVGKGTFTIFEAKELVARHLTPAGASGSGGSGTNDGGGSSASANRAGGTAVTAAEQGLSSEDEDEDGEECDDDDDDENDDDDERAMGNTEVDTSVDGLLARGPVSEAAAAAGAAAERRAASLAVAAAGTGQPAADEPTAAPPASAAAPVPASADAILPPPKRARRLAPPPVEFLCPITQEMMVDPVFTTDGHTYEKTAVQRWLTHKRTSPLTGALLSSTNLIPNHALRKLIEEHIARTQYGRAAGGSRST